MAEEDLRAAPARDGDSKERGLLLRLSVWTFAAIVAVASAILVGGSENGLRRIAGALSDVQTLPPQHQASRDDGEMQKLSESLRQINTDRIRMIARLEAIERHLDEITGTISRGTSAPPAAAPENSPTAETSGAAAAAPGAIAPTPQQQVIQSPPTAEVGNTDTATPTKSDFGVDLGSAQTVDGLRMLWTQVKSRHGTLLEGMRPIIVIREPARAGAVELRLVAGPIPSASLAAKLCVAMNAAGALCQPAVFDGQRLALR